MALTTELELPRRTLPSEGWSAKRLFPVKAFTSAFSKVFVTPFDVLLSLLVFAIVIVEVFSDGSWMLYGLTVLVLAADVFERYHNKDGILMKKQAEAIPQAPQKTP